MSGNFLNGTNKCVPCKNESILAAKVESKKKIDKPQKIIKKNLDDLTDAADEATLLKDNTVDLKKVSDKVDDEEDIIEDSWDELIKEMSSRDDEEESWAESFTVIKDKKRIICSPSNSSGKTDHQDQDTETSKRENKKTKKSLENKFILNKSIINSIHDIHLHDFTIIDCNDKVVKAELIVEQFKGNNHLF